MDRWTKRDQRNKDMFKHTAKTGMQRLKWTCRQ